MTIFIERYAPKIRVMLFRIGIGESNIDDVMQDIYIRVLQKIKGLHKHKGFKGWLRTLVKNIARDHVTSTKSYMSLDQILENGGGSEILQERSGNDGIKAAIEAGHAQIVRHTVSQLPEQSRDLIRQFYFKDLSLEQMGGIAHKKEAGMSTPLGTIQSRLHTARKQAKELVEPYSMQE